MTNFKYSAKFKIFACISTVVIVLGLILGTVYHFTLGGFYNYGGEYEDSKTLTVSYQFVEFGTPEEVEDIIDGALSEHKISAYSKIYAKTQTGGTFTYKFTTATSDDKLSAAVDSIKDSIKTAMKDYTDVVMSTVSWSTSDNVLGGGLALWRGAVAIAVVVVIQLIYVCIRFGLTATIAACCADLHNFGLYAAILALCRIPVTSSALAFGALVVLVTIIGAMLTFERLKRNSKNEDYKKLSAAELSDMSANETSKINIILPACLAAVAAIAFAIYAISASLLAIIPTVICALVAFAVCVYGTAFVLPAALPAIWSIVNKIKPAKPSKKGK